MKLVIAASLAILAFGALETVNAQGVTEVVVTGRKAPAPGTEVQSRTVTYADLDLSKSAGVSTLLGRIRGAAKDVCSPEPQTNDIAASKDYKKCTSHAVSSAVMTVNNTGLTALAAGAGH